MTEKTGNGQVGRFTRFTGSANILWISRGANIFEIFKSAGTVDRTESFWVVRNDENAPIERLLSVACFPNMASASGTIIPNNEAVLVSFNPVKFEIVFAIGPNLFPKILVIDEVPITGTDDPPGCNEAGKLFSILPPAACFAKLRTGSGADSADCKMPASETGIRAPRLRLSVVSDSPKYAEARVISSLPKYPFTVSRRSNDIVTGLHS